MTKQLTKAATMRKPLLIASTSAPEMRTTRYLPSTGMQPIQTAAIRMRRYRRSGSGSLSAHLPPKTLPRAIAIMMVPMMMVHTICDEEKYGARRRLAPSSTAITDMPDRNAVR